MGTLQEAYYNAPRCSASQAKIFVQLLERYGYQIGKKPKVLSIR